MKQCGSSGRDHVKIISKVLSVSGLNIFEGCNFVGVKNI